MKFSTFALASVAAMAASYAPAAEATGMVLKDPNGSTFPACYDVSGDIHGMAKLLLGWDEGRALRGDRKLPSCPPSNWCRTNCAGFPPGSCQLGKSTGSPISLTCCRLQYNLTIFSFLSFVSVSVVRALPSPPGRHPVRSCSVGGHGAEM